MLRSSVFIERGSAAQVFAVDGSAAAPSIAFASDSDTGFYLLSTGIFLAVAGSSTVCSFSNNNVGCGNFSSYGATALNVFGRIADGAGAIGVKLFNYNALTAGTDRYCAVFYSDNVTTARAWVCTDGTGIFSNLKFGTYNATGDVACNGYVTITDYAGNARKLMTTA